MVSTNKLGRIPDDTISFSFHLLPVESEWSAMHGASLSSYERFYCDVKGEGSLGVEFGISAQIRGRTFRLSGALEMPFN